MIKHLILSDFRNYETQDIKFGNKVNVLIGENGQGKTNVLEAIYFLAFLRSFRTTCIEDLKRINTSSFYVGSELSLENWNKLLEVEYSGKKFLKVDKVPIKKASEFIGLLKAVVFSHEDIKLISGASKIRRRNLDIFISLQNKEYLLQLQNYVQALKSRNILLRNTLEDVNILGAYESILSDYGSKILLQRYEIINQLSQKGDRIIKEIKGNNFDLKIKYVSRVKYSDISKDYILKLMSSEREKDFKRGYTTLGPHLDDIELYLNNKNLKSFGSMGECRLTSLCLKLAESEMVTEKNKEASIALIDDVSGELDTKTKDAFYKMIDRFGQIFLTFTKKPEESYFSSADNYMVRNGSVLCG